MKTISIESSRPIIDIHTQNARLVIDNKIRRSMKITTEPPRMVVDRKYPSFNLNWNKVRSQSGLRSLNYLQQFLSQKNRQKVYEAISNIVDAGDYISDSVGNGQAGSNPIAELSDQQMKIRENAPELNVASMPQDNPEIQWDPGYVKVEWIAGETKIEWEEDYRPDVKVVPHTVEIRLKGERKLKISVNEDKLPTAAGKKVNKNI